MSLQPGTTLGHYDVTSLLGEGGMGEVWQARDTKLDRDVALKVLPEAFTSDPDRLARFEREAKVLASLNHPNIGSIYGLEEAEGVRALVLELVEGPTLADRIKQGPIPIDEALPIAKQIAEALEAAHERGVIHRDLKPANIKVKDDGTVKVLDFGLAKAFQPDASDPNMSAISEFPKGRKYLISLSFRGKASVRPAQVGGFDVNIVIHGSTAVRGRGDLVAYRWALWKLTAPWTHRTRPPHLGKRCAFSTSSTGPFPSNHSRKTPKGPKIALGNPDRPNMSMSPTISLTAAATQMGMVIGTAAYMAPEQASGEAIDKRCDIWSFGVVLFEMLTARRVFEGKTVAHVLSAVLQVDPQWDTLPSALPSPLDRLLRRCLEKNPKQRLRDIGEARVLLEEAATTPTQPARRETVGVAGWRLVVALGAAVVAGAVLAGLTPPGSPDAPPMAPTTFALATTGGV